MRPETQTLQVLAYPPSLSKFIQESKMAQFIRTPINNADLFNVLNHCTQVSQVSYRNFERAIEIDWDYENNRVIVQDNGGWFYFSSPDIDHLTIYQVLGGLGYGNEQMVVTWAEDGDENAVLNSNVSQATLNQITLSAPNQPIPQVNNNVPLPQVAGQPALNDPNIPNPAQGLIG